DLIAYPHRSHPRERGNGERRRRYINFAMTPAVSIMRFEKPHSLSYHETTRASLPSSTAVSRLSTVELAGWWLKSLLTSGWSVYSSTPFIGPSAAALSAALSSSFDVSRPGVKARSISETFGVGTRTEEPSSLPFNSGSTRPTARAAPVVVGIMFIAPARARRRSEWI